MELKKTSMNMKTEKYSENIGKFDGPGKSWVSLTVDLNI